MRRFLLFGVIIGAIGITLFVMQQREPDSTLTFDALPPFSLSAHDGSLVSSSDFSEKALVLNAWATWCPFCKNELPDFAALQEMFPDDVTVIAINRQESLAEAKQYTDEKGLSDALLFLLDPSDSFYKSIGGFTMPETLFVSADGDIVVHKRGPMTLEEMITHTNAALSYD